MNTRSPTLAQKTGNPSLQLAAIFAGFVLVLVALGVVLQRQSKAAAEAAAVETLHSSSRLSAHGLNLWVAERFADADTLADSPLLVEVLARWLAGGATQGAEPGALLAHLERVRSYYDYRAVVLLDAGRNRVLVGRGRALSPEDIRRVAEVAAAAGSGRSQWVELPAPAGADLRMGVARGVIGVAEMPPVVLYMEFEPRHLVKTLQEALPQNWHGETLLLRKAGNAASYLSPGQDAVLQPLQAVGGAVPVELQLISGDAKQISGSNRNAQPVLAMRESVRMPSWHLVSMLSEDAVYAPLYRQTRITLVTLVALLLLGGLVFEAWRRNLAYRQALRDAGMRRYYEEVLRNAADMFVLADAQGVVMEASESALRAYGYTRARMLGLPAARLRSHASEVAPSQIVAGLEPGQTRDFQSEHVRADGSRFAVEGSVGVIEIDGSRYYHMIARDLSDQRRMQAQMRIAASFFERFNAGIVVSSHAFRQVMVNPAFTQLTGYVAEDVVGPPGDLLFAEPESEHVRQLREDVRRHDHWEGEVLGRRKNGEVFPARLLVSVYRTAQGEVEQIVNIFTDQTRLKQAEREAQYLAQYDGLTGLPNRASLQRHLRLLLERTSRDGDSVTVALLNLDHFMHVNESLGNTHGDALLVAVAQRLRALFPDPQTLFRYGGDEFVVVMAGTPLAHAVLLDQVRGAIAPALRLGEHSVLPTASTGVASFPEQAGSAEALLRNVEAAMRMAKSQGRNTWRLYQPEMNATVFDDMLLAADLRQAIDRRELALHLQPQYRLVDGVLVGMEALLRWNHASRGMVSPARFIPIAESSGLIIDLSDWVLREACRIWAGWRDAGVAPPPVAVNLSALQFQRPGFVDAVARAMADFAIPPHALEMELTESLIMGNTDAAIATMHKLVGMGIQLAIDDFGTGYSSLSYLRRFPVGKLKIDRSFVLDLERGREGAAIANAIISMATSLNLKVIAEGVETEAQRDFLRDSGCDEVQGYLYSKPLAVDAMTRLLEQRHAAIW